MRTNGDGNLTWWSQKMEWLCKCYLGADSDQIRNYLGHQRRLIQYEDQLRARLVVVQQNPFCPVEEWVVCGWPEWMSTRALVFRCKEFRVQLTLFVPNITTIPEFFRRGIDQLVAPPPDGRHREGGFRQGVMEVRAGVVPPHPHLHTVKTLSEWAIGM